MFQSPLKTVSEKIKPVQSKSTVASLKFERSSDFKKFIDFIKKETQEIENLKLPKKDDIKPKSKLPNALGILGLAGFAALAALFGGDKKDKKGEKPFVSFAGGTKFALKSKSLITSSPKKRFKVAFQKDKALKKTFRKIFKKPSKSEIAELKLTKGFRKTVRENKIKELLKDKKILEDQKRLAKTLQFGDDVDMKILQKEINFINQEIKNLVNASKVEDDIFKIINSEKSTTSNFKSRVNALRQLIDESKVSFDRRGNVKFAPQSDLASRLTIQNIINSSPQGKDLIKKIARMDPLLFDVPEGATLFSKILGRDKGIKIENKMGIVRESLDDFFTGIGKSTKTLRGRISKFGKSFMKSKTPTLGLRSVLGTGSKAFKFLTSSRVSFAATFLSLFYDSYDAIVNQDDPFTGYYNVFVRYHNKIVKDPTKLRLIKGKVSNRIGLSQEKMDKINLERDRYNQDILRRRNAAKNNNEISSVPQNSSGIVPIAQKKQSAPFEITLSPTINSTKFINEKLYKQ